MVQQFASEARSFFDPIGRGFGLTCSASTEQGLRYESDEIILRVNFDNGRSYELGVEIGRKQTAGGPARFHSLGEVPIASTPFS